MTLNECLPHIRSNSKVREYSIYLKMYMLV